MKFEYELMIPLASMSSFETMTAAEATEHFEWFVRQSPERVVMLKRAYAYDMGSSSDLDGTGESLVSLLRWLATHAAISTHLDDTKKGSSLPEWARSVGIAAKELSTLSLAIAVDAGFYLAEIFRRKYPGKVEWTLWKEEGDHYYNRPVLDGFGGLPLMPHEILETCTWGILNGRKDEQRLKKIFDVWAAKIK